MEDYLGSRSYSVLVEGRPFDNFVFQVVVDHRDEFKGKGLKDRGGRYAMREEIIQF